MIFEAVNMLPRMIAKERRRQKTITIRKRMLGVISTLLMYSIVYIFIMDATFM